MQGLKKIEKLKNNFRFKNLNELYKHYKNFKKYSKFEYVKLKKSVLCNNLKTYLLDLFNLIYIINLYIKTDKIFNDVKTINNFYKMLSKIDKEFEFLKRLHSDINVQAVLSSKYLRSEKVLFDDFINVYEHYITSILSSLKEDLTIINSIYKENKTDERLPELLKSLKETFIYIFQAGDEYLEIAYDNYIKTKCDET